METDVETGAPGRWRPLCDLAGSPLQARICFQGVSVEGESPGDKGS